MGELLSWLSANWLVLVTTLLAVVGGASVIVKAVAPWTKSDTDNRLAAWLDKVHGWLSKIALNPPKE